MAGRSIGRVIDQKRFHAGMPSTSAASKISGEISCRPARIKQHHERVSSSTRR